MSSRFVPLSYEVHKGPLPVKGEVLIERQIRQLHEAGITDITVVTGYRKEDFRYLKDEFGVTFPTGWSRRSLWQRAVSWPWQCS